MEKSKIEAYALKNAVEHDGKAQANSVLNSLFACGLQKEEIKKIMPLIQEIVKKTNSLSLDEQKKKFDEIEKDGEISHRDVREEGELPELENAEKNHIVMRFAPAPSGPLHIGHIISNMISSLYVKKYGGKFYVRIEDTNPEKTLESAYENIKQDCDWLFGNVFEYIIQSDRLHVYYNYAEKMIKTGYAYICTCKSEKFKELVDKSVACPCRKLDVDENIKRWKNMLDKQGYKEGKAVLRFRSDLNNPNPAMRDFPLARINVKKHPRQGKKFRVWPLMNLSVTIDDISYGMTHIIRGKDHKDNATRQRMIYQALGLEEKYPIVKFIGRVKFTDMILSKRKLTIALNEGEFESASDVRLPTWISLRKRGYQPEAFAKMAIKRGISEVDKVMSSKDYLAELNLFNREAVKEKAIKSSFEKQLKKSEIEILMPDALVIYGKSDLDIKKLKEGQIIYFSGLGYACYNSEEKIKFWFGHE